MLMASDGSTLLITRVSRGIRYGYPGGLSRRELRVHFAGISTTTTQSLPALLRTSSSGSPVAIAQDHLPSNVNSMATRARQLSADEFFNY